MMFKCDFTLRHIPAYAQSDICWWLRYAQSWNGVQILAEPQPTLHVYTDASSLKGLGSIFEDNGSRADAHATSGRGTSSLKRYIQ